MKVEEGEKVCSKCGNPKLISDFYKTNGYVWSRCKDCISDDRQEKRLKDGKGIREKRGRDDGSNKKLMKKGERYCPRCTFTGKLKYFYAGKSYKNGYSVYCKECEKELDKERRLRNREKNKNMDLTIRMKRCSNKDCCEKPTSEFHIVPERTDGYSQYCKICMYELNKLYIDNNRDKINKKSLARYYEDVEKSRVNMRSYQRRGRENLVDSYVKAIICHGTSLQHGDIPQELIIAKRAQLTLHRASK